MSKRHQSNRRKSYGRRQHELHERVQRDQDTDGVDPAMADDFGLGATTDRFGFMDTRTTRLRYALGD
ncbi:MAG TPA: hypothetical protein VGM28_02410 [Candidatus Limnocylindrales bacterium]